MQITFNAIATAYQTVNTAYIAKHGTAARLNSKGYQGDIASGLNIFSRFTDAQWADLNKFAPAELVSQAARTGNVKTLKRLPSLLLFAIAGDVKDLKGSARTCAIEICALLIGCKTREGLLFAATGKGNEHTSDVINTSLARKVQGVLGRIGATTEATQNSVSFASGNLGDVLNIAHKDKRTALPVVVADSPIVQRIASRVSELTESQIGELKGDKPDAGASDNVIAEKIKGKGKGKGKTANKGKVKMNEPDNIPELEMHDL